MHDRQGLVGKIAWEMYHTHLTEACDWDACESPGDCRSNTQGARQVPRPAQTCHRGPEGLQRQTTTSATWNCRPDMGGLEISKSEIGARLKQNHLNQTSAQHELNNEMGIFGIR